MSQEQGSKPAEAISAEAGTSEIAAPGNAPLGGAGAPATAEIAPSPDESDSRPRAQRRGRRTAPTFDPSKPLPGEMSPERRQMFLMSGTAILCLGLGSILGFALTPETSEEANTRIATLEQQLGKSAQRVKDLERALLYTPRTNENLGGKLKAADRERHERAAQQYAKALRQVKAQSAGELVRWFVSRWNALLDRPEHNDRAGRRAELLSKLVGGMAANVDPRDYVPWQAEFFAGDWLGDVHFDLDGDGLPGSRSMPNTHDGFVDASACQIAMAINQVVLDARVFVMPDMKCDGRRPSCRFSCRARP